MAAADDLAAALRSGSRRALGRAVTLVESTRPDHREDAERLIETFLPLTGGATRIGITGPPGAREGHGSPRGQKSATASLNGSGCA